ncbi:hypothetical protein MNBD_GAMMA20-1048 [hydrothermal vent metagenome]|uniref:Flagellar brake protein YcgR n=1 Tax=hydrothermal vent metagenome TaxID=652676 RepID=A0A3B1AKI9_9ZZZZ
MAQQQTEGNNYQQQYEEVTSTTRITAILRPLQQQHSIISIAVPSAKHLYNSTLLEVNPEQNYLLLDELHPREGHTRLSTASKIGLSAHREGIEIKIILEISEIGADNGVAFYRVPFPKIIRYRQRRHIFRVPVSVLQSIQVELVDAQDNAFHGELQDISAAGMCVRFPPKTAIEEKAQTLTYTMTLPDKKRVQGQFTLRRITQHEPNRNIQVGGSFEQLDKIQARTIERFVLEIQRESRRKMSR